VSSSMSNGLDPSQISTADSVAIPDSKLDKRHWQGLCCNPGSLCSRHIYTLDMAEQQVEGSSISMLAQKNHTRKGSPSRRLANRSEMEKAAKHRRSAGICFQGRILKEQCPTVFEPCISCMPMTLGKEFIFQPRLECSTGINISSTKPAGRVRDERYPF